MLSEITAFSVTDSHLATPRPYYHNSVFQLSHFKDLPLSGVKLRDQGRRYVNVMMMSNSSFSGGDSDPGRGSHRKLLPIDIISILSHSHLFFLTETVELLCCSSCSFNRNRSSTFLLKTQLLAPSDCVRVSALFTGHAVLSIREKIHLKYTYFLS